MRNKEEKLRNKLKKQGLSEKEIEKIVKSKNKKLAPKLIVGTFATALIVAGVVFVVNNFKKGNSAIKNETPAEKIAKEEDEKLKEELEKDKPDKNPDDIVIPVVPTKEDGATDEEIAEAQQKADEAKKEKDYWQIIKQIKTQIKELIKSTEANYNDENLAPNYIKNLQSIRRINNFYVGSDGSLIADIDLLYTENFGDASYMKQMNMIYSFGNENIELNDSSATDILNFIQDTQTQTKLLTNFVESNFETGLEDFYNNHLKNFAGLKELQDDGYDVELQDMKCTLASFSEVPMRIFCVSKATKGEDVKYNYMEINISMVTMEMTLDQWVEYSKTSNNDNFHVGFDQTYKSAELDWKALSEEYSGQKTQEAQAQAEIEEISTRNENGNVTGFDWNAYTDLMKQKEAEKEAKELEQTVTQQESVTYSDQELSL